MLTFVRNEKGRPEAQEGTHDDLVMGLAITYYIRDQQDFKLQPREYEQPPEDDFSEFVTTTGYIKDDDFGSPIEII